MPPNNAPKKTRKQYTRRTAKEKLSEKIERIENALKDIRSMVDVHCGEQVIKTARAAGAAAADEVLMTLSPASMKPASQAFATLAPSVEQEEEQEQEQKQEESIFEEKAAVIPSGEPPAKAKKPGPQLWNEFLRNYMRNQKEKGRNITRLQAMAEAGPNYRAKYSLPDAKPRRKTVKIPKNLGGIQAAPVVSENRRVRIAAPENMASVTPGRQSPPRPMANNGKPLGILNTLASVFTPTSASSASSASTASNASNSGRPSPSSYLYTNLGKNSNNPARKILLDNQEYFMSDEDRGLFRRSGSNTGEWVGYLEPGGRIRYTEDPNA
jgi:hypothetical protein